MTFRLLKLFWEMLWKIETTKRKVSRIEVPTEWNLMFNILYWISCFGKHVLLTLVSFSDWSWIMIVVFLCVTDNVSYQAENQNSPKNSAKVMGFYQKSWSTRPGPTYRMNPSALSWNTNKQVIMHHKCIAKHGFFL